MFHCLTKTTNNTCLYHHNTQTTRLNWLNSESIRQRTHVCISMYTHWYTCTWQSICMQLTICSACRCSYQLAWSCHYQQQPWVYTSYSTNKCRPNLSWSTPYTWVLQYALMQPAMHYAMHYILPCQTRPCTCCCPKWWSIPKSRWLSDACTLVHTCTHFCTLVHTHVHTHVHSRYTTVHICINLYPLLSTCILLCTLCKLAHSVTCMAPLPLV